MGHAMIARTRTEARSRLRTATLVVIAVALPALAIWQRGALALAVGRVAAAGWVVVPAFAVFLVWNYVASIGWRDLARAVSTPALPPLWRLSILRLGRQALPLIVPAPRE